MSIIFSKLLAMLYGITTFPSSCKGSNDSSWTYDSFLGEPSCAISLVISLKKLLMLKGVSDFNRELLFPIPKFMNSSVNKLVGFSFSTVSLSFSFSYSSITSNSAFHSLCNIFGQELDLLKPLIEALLIVLLGSFN